MRSAVLAIGLVAVATGPSRAAAVGAGTKIANTASASYVVGQTSFVTLSNTVNVTVSQVSAIAVSPYETVANPATDTFGIGVPLVKTFTLTNTSNIADAYVVTAAACAPGALTSLTYPGATGAVPIVVGQTVLPMLPPGGTIAVTVTCATQGVPVQTQLPVTISARTTVPGSVNGIVAGTGRMFGIAVPPPTISGTGGPSTSIQKTVANVNANGTAAIAAVPGATTTYAISFMNSGAVAATNVVMADTFPAGMTPDPSSLTVNGLATGFTAKLSGQTLSVAVGTLAVKQIDVVKVNALVSRAQVAGVSAVNVASVTADGLAPTPTTPAVVFVGTANVVYDGLAGASHVVQGAVVTMLDPATMKPMALASSGVAPNAANANPYTTAASGIYQFAPFAPGASTPVAHFVMTITAPNYVNRKIDVTTTPSASSTSASTSRAPLATTATSVQLYNVTLTSLDGQPLAQAGGFTLTTTNVQLSNIFDLLGNLPLFTARPITVTKTVDRPQASPGDKLIFDIGYVNASPGQLSGGSIVDTLPPGVLYVPNSATIDGVAVAPAIAGRTLTWPIAALAIGIGHKLEYACVIAPGTPPHSKLTNTVVVGAQIPGTTIESTGSASVDIDVVRGLFSQSGVITGRVFVDAFGTGRFKHGDRGVPGVRVYLESGEFALTDPQGRFTFPSVRPGQHVLRLDPLTIPAGVAAFDDARYDSPFSTDRLVHGLFDTGLMEDVNFALRGGTS